MSYARMKEMIEQLYRRTMDGSLTWEETEAIGVYQTSFPNFAVRISMRHSQTEMDSTDYWVSIYNADGRMIDEVSDVGMAEDFNPEGVNAYLLMRELYDSARRAAMGVEDALSEILKQLGGTESKKEDPGESNS